MLFRSGLLFVLYWITPILGYIKMICNFEVTRYDRTLHKSETIFKIAHSSLNNLKLLVRTDHLHFLIYDDLILILVKKIHSFIICIKCYYVLNVDYKVFNEKQLCVQLIRSRAPKSSRALEVLRRINNFISNLYKYSTREIIIVLYVYHYLVNKS